MNANFRPQRVLLLLLALTTLLLAACSSQEPAATTVPAASATPATASPAPSNEALGSAPVVQVQALLFSGRPDPSWRLSDEQALQLVAALAALGPSGESTPPPDGLGYRGFRVDLNEATGEIWSFQAYEGLVRRERAGAVDYLADPQRSVEQALAGTAAGQLDPAIVKVIQDALGQ